MFLIYLVLPALIGVKEYGIFSYVLSICFIFCQPLIEFGLDPIIIKYSSRNNDSIFRKALFLRLKTSVLSFIILIISALIFKIDLNYVIILFFYFFFFSLANLIFAFFRGKEKFIYESVLLTIFRIFIIIFIFFFSKILNINNFYTGSIPFSFSALLILLISAVIFNKNYQIKNTRLNDKTDIVNSGLLKEGGLLFLSTILWMIYFRIDTVMLGTMVGETEVGVYSLAYRFYEGSIFLASSVMIVLFPKISSTHGKKLVKIFIKGFFILLAASVFTFLGLYFLGEPVIKYFYSSEYITSIKVLKILSFSVLIVFPAHLTTQLLIARDKNFIFLLITLSGAVLNIVLNLFLIPQLKSTGAAVSTVITEALILITSFIFSLWLIKKEYS